MRSLLPTGLPEAGAPAPGLLAEAASLLFEHSTFNGHPRFFGYITSSAAPIGALADLLAAAVNPNVGAWPLSPAASEIEGQCIRWIAGLLGMPHDTEGLLVTGGNITYVMDRLEDQGYVFRDRSGPDRRVVTARLTDDGEELISQVFPGHAEFIGERRELAPT